MEMGVRQHPRRRGRRRFAALVVVAAVSSVLPAFETAGGAAVSDRPGFRHVGTIPVRTEVTSTAHGAVELDSVHRRAYQYYQSQEPDGSGGTTNFLEFRVWDLDSARGGTLAELPRIRIDADESEAPCHEDPNDFVPWLACQGETAAANATGPLTNDNSRLSVVNLLREPVWAVDPAGGRLFYVADRAVYEVSGYDAATGSYSLAKWVAPPNPGAVPEAMNLPSGTQHFLPKGLTFDPDARLDTTSGDPAPTLYTVGNLKATTAQDTDVNSQGVWLAGWDASPTPEGAVQPVLRQRWLYLTRSCRNLDRTPTTSNEQVVVRVGEWLYTYCDGSVDEAGRGIVRVRLARNATGILEPVPETEQFFPGVGGEEIETAADPRAERLYVTTNNPSTGTRSVLVFDGTVGQGRGGYVGEIALSKRPDLEESELPPGEVLDAPVVSGFDVGTGRWYFQSKDGLSYQDGRIVTPLDAVAQINEFPRDHEGDSLFGQSTRRRILVDDAVVAADGEVVRPARLYVARNDRYDVYEDTSPYPGEPLPRTENTLNVPEGPGRAGTYSAVASGYGIRFRVMRGFSTVWPSGVAPLQQSFEDPSDPADESGQPATPTDWLQDPFYFYVGDCGKADRELAVARTLGATLSGNQFSQDAQAVALAVDPDVHRPSSADDTRTRDELAHPDPVPISDEEARERAENGGEIHDWEREEGCTRQLFEAMTRSDTDPADGNLDGLGQDWPYDTTRCQGDADPDPVEESFPMAGEADVVCGATAPVPAVTADAAGSFSPTGFPVTVRETRVHTSIVRTPGQGVEAVSEAVVRGIAVAGVVEIDEMRVKAVVRAAGYATEEGSTAGIEGTTRTFAGLTVGGAAVCEADCPEATVLEALNAALGPYGYVEAPQPEPDFTLGTSQGTLAVVQKNLLEQASDSTTNRDFSTEWPGLEIGVYRDGVERGRGRWILQLGGVYAQTQFGVVPVFASTDNPPPPTLHHDPPPPSTATQVLGGGAESPAEEFVPDRIIEVPLGDSSEPASAVGIAEPATGLLERIREGIQRSLKAAALLAGLWSLVFAPVYVARRRNLLKQVARPRVPS